MPAKPVSGFPLAQQEILKIAWRTRRESCRTAIRQTARADPFDHGRPSNASSLSYMPTAFAGQVKCLDAIECGFSRLTPRLARGRIKFSSFSRKKRTAGKLAEMALVPFEQPRRPPCRRALPTIAGRSYECRFLASAWRHAPLRRRDSSTAPFAALIK